MADVVFPLETHAEKDGTVTHPDGRLQRVRPSASRPGDIRPNWGVLAELALALGHDTGVSSQPSAFAALAEAALLRRHHRRRDRRPRNPLAGPRRRLAPARLRAVRGGQRGCLRTLSAERLPKARRPQRSSRARPGTPDGSLALGTYRDLWAGPITELNPPLRFLAPQQRVEMSVADAERLGLKSGDEVNVAQNGTQRRARRSPSRSGSQEGAAS